MILYFVRHGDPTYDPDALTPLGQRQAESVGKMLARKNIDTIYSSTSNRAVQTALPLAQMLHKEITQLAWCHEKDCRDTFGVVGSDGVERWIFQDPDCMKLMGSEDVLHMGFQWYEHPSFQGLPCAQGIARIGNGADALLRKHGYEHDAENHCYRISKEKADSNERIALFAHEGVSKVFLSHILDIPYPIFTKFLYCHTGVTTVLFRAKGDVVIPKVLQYSSDTHLYMDGLPTGYQTGMEG